MSSNKKLVLIVNGTNLQFDCNPGLRKYGEAKEDTPYHIAEAFLYKALMYSINDLPIDVPSYRNSIMLDMMIELPEEEDKLMETLDTIITHPHYTIINQKWFGKFRIKLL